MKDPQAPYQLLETEGIRYQRFDHPAVYTCAEASMLAPIPDSLASKNLFLKAGKTGRYLLLCLPASARLDLKALGEILAIKSLGFASAERLLATLGLTPGAVSLLAVINDSAGLVDVIIDKTVAQQDTILCHPLVNTSTLAINTGDLLRFLDSCDHTPRVMSLPCMPI
ncbi:prolyl-tRNA synthetase associated domain-containing protein [Aquitalea sp. LB_tupeE]|uniref:prolyl-tRNA synthetase associated domain-containing protein n=1 Tax=Aquitalea sp. LB_tupeE TaxID=2748078 RepID=UPI0015B81F35|nr:prolyl-tRNA synthetase associated domain-containing protein [Aquitalea sp. LB_tupeE]NWK79699.1 prolyl-tRNA synthetase associated domain-containing protein [Aquitalea sp. LB_tupeE]